MNDFRLHFIPGSILANKMIKLEWTASEANRRSQPAKDAWPVATKTLPKSTPEGVPEASKRLRRR